MSAEHASAPARDGPPGSSAPLRRDMEHRVLAGVLAGVANRLDVDPLLVRIGFVIVALLTAGAAIAAYVLAWIAIPKEGTDEATGRRPRLTANTRVAAGVGFLTLALLLVLREIGLWWSDVVVWPLILAAAGAALLWRQSRTIAGEAAEPAPTASETLRAEAVTAPRPRPERHAGVADLYRGGFGVALIAGAALIVLSATGALSGVKDAVIVIVVVILALALCLAPFWWRLGRNLASERSERIRSQERAELGAHLHDSVVQTLTLIQKRADDPREVAQLARRQERELRDWLFAPERKPAAASLATALSEVAVEVEEAHRVPIDVIAVGDAGVGERGRGAGRRGPRGDGERREVRARRGRGRGLCGARQRPRPGVRARPRGRLRPRRGPGRPPRRAGVDHREDGALRRQRHDPLGPGLGHRGRARDDPGGAMTPRRPRPS